MTARGHVIFAITLAIVAKRFHFTPILNQGDWWHIIPSAILTSLLPDIDHPRSILGYNLRWLSYPITYLFGHRGITHSLLAVVIINLELVKMMISTTTPIITMPVMPTDVLQGMIIGYISHLIADFITPVGIPLLWPLRWRFRLPIIQLQTCKNIDRERIVCFALLCLVVVIPSFYLDYLLLEITKLNVKILLILQNLLHIK
ncbi:MAG: metal-dependent hydrolase [Candidatus Dasytiphilus stammeri]